MSMGYSKKNVNVAEIKVNVTDNVRLARDFSVAGQQFDTYDLDSMIEAIVAKKGIVTPVVLDGNGYVLQGFRRTLAGQKLVQNPDKYITDATVRGEVLSALSKVPALVYANLTTEERLSLINDHGDRKGIGRVELIRAVWRLWEANYSEKEIIQQLYYALAEYTGNVKKLNTLPAVGSPEREKALGKWFHGTVGNLMLKVWELGQELRDDFLLTEAKNDGLLGKDSTIKPRFVVKRDRITELSKAKTQDEKDGAWDSDKKSGPAFAAKLQEFITEDENGGPARQSDTRMGKDDMKKRSENSASTAFKLAYRMAMGEQVNEAPDVDKATARAEAVFTIIDKHVEQVGNPLVKDVLTRVLYASPADFEQFILQQCSVATEQSAEAGQTVS